MSEPTTLTISERIIAVLADMPAIGKDRQAPSSMGGYSYRGIEDIASHLKPLLAKHQIFASTRTLERVESTRQVQASKIMYAVDLHVEFAMVGPDGDSIVGDCWGCGTDMGDKATQKAMTSAWKTFLSVTFCIADSASDSEAANVPETDAPPTEPRRTFAEAGFKDRADAEASVAKARDLVEAASIVDWVRDQQFPWPWSKAACDAIVTKANATIAAREPATPPSADPDPKPPENASSEGEPPAGRALEVVAAVAKMDSGTVAAALLRSGGNPNGSARALKDRLVAAILANDPCATCGGVKQQPAIPDATWCECPI